MALAPFAVVSVWNMAREIMKCVRVIVLAVAALGFDAAAAAPAVAQTDARADAQAAGQRGWDAERALTLIERARARRQVPAQDTLLRNYSARAEGFVYFYLDRRDTDERTLIKTDQIAIELYWAAPDRTRQHIVGLRDESRLPNRMYYHLDHLTVVQNGFGDLIRMGDGDEVRDVPHPAAPGSDTIYQFRLADSLTLRLPGAAEPIRVYELEVRPRRIDRPALVGSIFVDRGTADVVRMSFTFTPVSYVDRRLDHITVSLDNGLWEGRYWLPHEQTLQIRRQVPELDFAAAAVIQGRMRIGDYVFNDSLPPSLFLGHPVSADPHAQREAYPFERGIYDDLNAEGLATPTDLAEVRRRAAELLGTTRLSGLPTWRFGLGAASSALRYNRAEGVAVGAGLVYAPGPPWRVDLAAGYAFGAQRPWAQLLTRRETGNAGEARAHLLLRDTRDLGVRPAQPGAINTLASAFLGDDYLDPYFASGLRLAFSRALRGSLRGEIELIAERHRSAVLNEATALFSDSARFRAVRSVDEGDLVAAQVGAVRRLADPRALAWGGRVQAELGTFDGARYLRPTAELSGRIASASHERELLLTASGGTLIGRPPSQRLFLLGGTGTLPGYDYRAHAGTSFGLLDAQASASVLGPWLRLRLIGAAGAVGGTPTVRAQNGQAVPAAWQQWETQPTGGIRFSAGAGVSVLWDLLRVDWVRGLNGGGRRLLLSFHRDFWDIS
jgi:hypothetical protein